MEKNCGIILRNYYPYKQKISLFDKEYGRIEAGVSSKEKNQLNHGTIMRYTTVSNQSFITLSNLDIMLVPFALACHDIVFFHHILELCYYFLPPSAAAPETFDLIAYLFNAHPGTFNKRLILFRFFISLGMYPEQIPFENSYFHQLATQKLETFFKQKLDEMQYKVLESWLLQCIAMHPYKNQFKTISYEKYNGG